MSLSSGDLERIEEEMFTDRRITGSVYCGRCGYNLRTLPFCYHCPECGNEYNARPLKMKGIYVPFPGGLASVIRSFVGAAAFLAVTPIFAIPAFTAPEPHALSIAASLLVAVAGVGYFVQGIDRCRRWLRDITIARRIAADEVAESDGPWQVVSR